MMWFQLIVEKNRTNLTQGWTSYNHDKDCVEKKFYDIPADPLGFT